MGTTVEGLGFAVGALDDKTAKSLRSSPESLVCVGHWAQAGANAGNSLARVLRSQPVRNFARRKSCLLWSVDNKSVVANRVPCGGVP